MAEVGGFRTFISLLVATGVLLFGAACEGEILGDGLDPDPPTLAGVWEATGDLSSGPFPSAEAYEVELHAAGDHYSGSWQVRTAEGYILAPGQKAVATLHGDSVALKLHYRTWDHGCTGSYSECPDLTWDFVGRLVAEDRMEGAIVIPFNQTVMLEMTFGR